MSENVTYYSDERVQVTNAQAVFGRKSYPMDSIMSVTMEEKPTNWARGIVGVIIAGVGLLLTYVIVADNIRYRPTAILPALMLTGVPLVIVGIAALVNAKGKYIVKVGNVSGESNALSSGDQEYVQKIVDVMNEALIHVPTSRSHEPSEEALALFHQALAVTRDAGSNVGERHYRDAISLLSLATQKASTRFPRAHTLLSIYYYELEDSNLAKKHADIALKQEPTQFWAQLIKVKIAAQGIQGINLGGAARNLIPGGSGCGWAISVLAVLFVGGRASATQGRLKSELDKLVRIFKRLCTAALDADEFSSMAEELISLADALAGAKLRMGGRMPNIYREIANGPLEKIVYEDDTQRREVTRIRQLAQGRAMSSK